MVLVYQIFEDDFVAFYLFLGVGLQLPYLILRLRIPKLPLNLVQQLPQLPYLFLPNTIPTSMNLF